MPALFWKNGFQVNPVLSLGPNTVWRSGMLGGRRRLLERYAPLPLMSRLGHGRMLPLTRTLTRR